MRSRLLSTGPQGDTLFVGPAKYLPAARRLIERDRKIVSRVENGTYVVEFLDIPDDPSSVAEWGAAPTEEEALRYALGAAFGPDDDGYEEHTLWTDLQVEARPEDGLEVSE